MRILITGAAGFIGQRLARRLVEEKDITKITLTDAIQPPIPSSHEASAQTIALKADLTDPRECERVFLEAQDDSEKLDVVFVLHGIMSGGAEKDFELGIKVNVDSIRTVLDAARKISPGVKLIFSSSIAIFGGSLPPLVTEKTLPTPSSSYGAEKMICEYLVNDYSRRGFIDGRTLRFPTVVVRPGAPSAATSSFVSGIIREPLNGEKSVLPVKRDLELWICSPEVLVENIWHAVGLEAEALGLARQVNLPGIAVTVGEMLRVLEKVGGKEAVDLVEEREDSVVERIVGSWPARFDVGKALGLGFKNDEGFEGIVRGYIKEARLKY
ncbi:hypothetical protein RUND412_000381 [Rhizina undulata]